MEVKLRAKHNYSATRGDELSFRKKEEVFLVSKDVRFVSFRFVAVPFFFERECSI